MSKIILYIAQSLDGYISTTDGSVSWLDDFNNAGEDLGFNDLSTQVMSFVSCHVF